MGTPSRQNQDEPGERGCRNRMKDTAVSTGDLPSLGATADLALKHIEIGVTRPAVFSLNQRTRAMTGRAEPPGRPKCTWVGQ